MVGYLRYTTPVSHDDYFVAKLIATTGEKVWVVAYGSASAAGQNEVSNQIVFSNNYLYVIGSSNPIVNLGYEIFYSKLDTSGTLIKHK